jgi:DNA processing protein
MTIPSRPRPGRQLLTRPGPGRQRLARAALTWLAEPADLALGTLLETCEPARVLAAIHAGALPEEASAGEHPARRAAMARALARWQARLTELPGPDAITALTRQAGLRLACPGDPQWPERLDDLGMARPYALWLRGDADLAAITARSAAIVGSRAATGYGAYAAGQIAADLADQGWGIVSGGAYGIDAAAHRGALLTGGITIAVLACGTDQPYPAGHATLFADITGKGGLLISEWPPGRHPARMRFLVRNRVIAAITTGTVIIEAGQRSGALNTARHANELNRPLMAVPGPVTSAQSQGCHQIIKDWNASLVTSAADVLAMLSPIGSCPATTGPTAAPGTTAARGPTAARGADTRPLAAPSRDDLDSDSLRVLDAFPVRAAIGTSTIATEAGVDIDTLLRCLGRLAASGFIERSDQGWRLTRSS